MVHEMAAGAYHFARKEGLRIPEDLSVIGFDNVVLTNYLHPKLSFIDCHIQEMGQMAARWVIKHVYGEQDIEIQNTSKPYLVPRASVKSI